MTGGTGSKFSAPRAVILDETHALREPATWIEALARPEVCEG